MRYNGVMNEAVDPTTGRFIPSPKANRHLLDNYEITERAMGLLAKNGNIYNRFRVVTTNATDRDGAATDNTVIITEFESMTTLSVYGYIKPFSDLSLLVRTITGVDHHDTLQKTRWNGYKVYKTRPGRELTKKRFALAIEDPIQFALEFPSKRTSRTESEVNEEDEQQDSTSEDDE